MTYKDKERCEYYRISRQMLCFKSVILKIGNFWAYVERAMAMCLRCTGLIMYVVMFPKRHESAC